MKYILIIWVCSFLQGNACMAPVEYPVIYKSWYECSRAAHKESLSIMAKMGYRTVNNYHMGTRYTCKVVATY